MVKKMTALMVASRQGCAKIVKRLIDAGADVNARLADGRTALILATENGQFQSIELLIQAGADVNITADINLADLDCTKNIHAATDGNSSNQPGPNYPGADGLPAKSEDKASIKVDVPNPTQRMVTKPTSATPGEEKAPVINIAIGKPLMITSEVRKSVTKGSNRAIAADVDKHPTAFQAGMVDNIPAVEKYPALAKATGSFWGVPQTPALTQYSLVSVAGNAPRIAPALTTNPTVLNILPAVGTTQSLYQAVPQGVFGQMPPAVGNTSVGVPAVGNKSVGVSAVGNKSVGVTAVGNKSVGVPAAGNKSVEARKVKTKLVTNQ